MSDLISRKKLLEQIKADSEGQEGQYGDEWLFIDTINAIPTAEPKVGKWEECKVADIEDTTITEVQSAFCPICRKYHTTPYMYYFDYFNYCPNCGAKMERGADDD